MVASYLQSPAFGMKLADTLPFTTETPFGMFGLAMLRCPFAVLVSQFGGAGASLSHVCWILCFLVKGWKERMKALQ